jgi:Flp pilus assembly pilin Flp
MHTMARRLWTEDDGVLSFEWTLIVTVLVIGVVAGLAAARDAIVDELGDAAQAMLALDDSYVLDQPLAIIVDVNGQAIPPAAVQPGSATGSSFTDGQSFTDCARTTAGTQNQAGQSDTDS